MILTSLRTAKEIVAHIIAILFGKYCHCQILLIIKKNKKNSYLPKVESQRSQASGSCRVCRPTSAVPLWSVANQTSKP